LTALRAGLALLTPLLCLLILLAPPAALLALAALALVALALLLALLTGLILTCLALLASLCCPFPMEMSPKVLWDARSSKTLLSGNLVPCSRLFVNAIIFQNQRRVGLTKLGIKQNAKKFLGSGKGLKNFCPEPKQRKRADA
jgi:hypothetical protein